MMNRLGLLTLGLVYFTLGEGIALASSGAGIVAGPNVKRPSPVSDTPTNFTGTPKEVYDTCFRCHREQTPAEMERYVASKHYANQVECKDCHGTTDHNTYVALTYRFPLHTLGADGKTPIGSGEISTYTEWWPVMKIRAYQMCMSCHPVQYEEFIGVRRFPKSFSTAVTPFHGYLRYDMGISSWWDTVMANFGAMKPDCSSGMLGGSLAPSLWKQGLSISIRHTFTGGG